MLTCSFVTSVSLFLSQRKICTCQHGIAAEGATCSSHGEIHCERCTIERFKNTDTKKCDLLTKCTASSEYEASAPDGIFDRRCETKICSCLVGGVGAVGEGCDMHGQYQCDACISGYFMNSLEKCVALSVCDINQFEIQQPTQIQDRRCQQRTQCDNTQYEKFRGTQTTDRICSKKVCSCTNGIGSIGSKCTHHSSPSCETCNEGFELDIETKSCTLKTCTCDNGIAATGMECPKSNTLKCARCNTGFHGDHCEPNECLCDGGHAVVGALCSEHLATICDTCNSKTHFLRESTCEKKTTCLPFIEFQETAGTGKTDRVCATVTNCIKDTFLSEPANKTSNNKCSSITKCADSHFEAIPPTRTKDRVCFEKICKCLHGSPAKGIQCPDDEYIIFETETKKHTTRSTFGLSEKCIECESDYHLSGNVCKKNLVCKTGEIELAAPTTNKDRTCQPIQCTCTFGSGASFSQGCDKHGMQKCISCNNNGRYLNHQDACVAIQECRKSEYEHRRPTAFSNRICKKKQCKCENGIAAKGFRCIRNAKTICISCNENYEMGEQDQRCYLPDNHPIGINGGFVWHDTTVGEVEDTRDTLKLVIHDRLIKDVAGLVVNDVKISIHAGFVVDNDDEENGALRRRRRELNSVVTIEFKATGFGSKRTSEIASAVFEVAVRDGSFLVELKTKDPELFSQVTITTEEPIPGIEKEKEPGIQKEKEQNVDVKTTKDDNEEENNDENTLPTDDREDNDGDTLPVEEEEDKDENTLPVEEKNVPKDERRNKNQEKNNVAVVIIMAIIAFAVIVVAIVKVVEACNISKSKVTPTVEVGSYPSNLNRDNWPEQLRRQRRKFVNTTTQTREPTHTNNHQIVPQLQFATAIPAPMINLRMMNQVRVLRMNPSVPQIRL